MTDTPSSILLTREQSTGSNTNLWGGYLITTQRMTEQAAKGYQTLSVTGDATVSWTNYTTGNTGQCAHLALTGSLTGSATLTFPANMNWLDVHNNAGAAVTIKCSGGTGVTLPQGARALIFCNGTDYFSATPNWMPTASLLANSGDIMNYSQVQAYVAAQISAATTTIGGLMQRYVYTATGGETSKSGVDDNGNTLAYTPNSEIVSLNGAILVRNVDYVASDKTSITGLSAMTAGDVLTIVALAAVSVANALVPSNNLSDVGSTATAATNLGVGTTSTPTHAGMTLTGLLNVLAGIKFPAIQVPSSDPNTLDDYEEGAWTPVVTSSAGTITTASATGTYTKIGRLWDIKVTVTITTNGSGSTDVRATLPATPSAASTLAGRETAIAGKSLAGTIPAAGAFIAITNYDNTYPGSNGSILTLSGSFV